MMLVYRTLVALPVDGSVMVNEHDVMGLFTKKVTRPGLPGATANDVGQVLFVIVMRSEAYVAIPTYPLTLVNAMLGKAPITEFSCPDAALALYQVQPPSSGKGVGVGTGVGVTTGVADASGATEACGLAPHDAAAEVEALATGQGMVQVPVTVFTPTTDSLHVVPVGRFGMGEFPVPLQPINTATHSAKKVKRGSKCLIRIKSPPKKLSSRMVRDNRKEASVKKVPRIWAIREVNLRPCAHERKRACRATLKVL